MMVAKTPSVELVRYDAMCRAIDAVRQNFVTRMRWKRSDEKDEGLLDV